MNFRRIMIKNRRRVAEKKRVTESWKRSKEKKSETITQVSFKPFLIVNAKKSKKSSGIDADSIIYSDAAR